MEAIAWGNDVSSLVLGPLTERPDADWYAAPPGKWCPAQIVHHLALGLEYSGRTFASRRQHAPMRRRPRSAAQFVAYHLVMDAGWLPSGRQAPEATRPAQHPERQAVERQFREGVDLLRALAAELLPARATDLFVKHPVLGDLTILEWLRFHAWHCAHHAKQIWERLAR